jgi:gluconate 2-dehydrogenase gamma chain
MELVDAIDRRHFVALAALAAQGQAAPLQFFSKDEARWIETLMDHIIPADDTPGARETGCLYYLDSQLLSALARFAPAYRHGLAAFQTRFPDFLARNSAEQLRMLESLKSDSFFDMLIDHTMQGFYGSPAHGGNRDAASWKMLGIEKYMGEGAWQGAHRHDA